MTQMALGGGVRVRITNPDLPTARVSVREDQTPDSSLLVMRGPRGPVGPAGGENYSHHQTTPAAQWNLEHNLGRYAEPVVILDGEPTIPVWADVEFIDADHLIVVFPEPATGWAHI